MLLKEMVDEANLTIGRHLVPGKTFKRRAYSKTHKMSGHLVPGKAFPKEFIYLRIHED